MRLRAAQRRRLATLLDAAGGVEIAVALPWVRHWQTLGDERVLQWVAQAPLLATAIAAGDRVSSDDDFADCRHPYLLEELLAVSQSHERRLRGVYFTPQEIVQYIVRVVDHELVSQLGWHDGLATSDAQILDPAAGSGVFLAEVIRMIHRRVPAQQQWSEFVSIDLLPRLTGREILPAGIIAAQCLLVETLRDTGYTFGHASHLRIEQHDALAPPDESERFNVVLGNPPYASLSMPVHGWIEGLITADYLHVDGQPLGEKKHWLHDDYVKFLRLAQWHVEQCGSGVVGMVTNHGYLQNASFRGMRASLLKTFPRIQIVDLHGNAKLQERSPNGRRDENVFGIASGAAIGIFSRPRDLPPRSVVEHTDLWGSRAEKLKRLTADAMLSNSLSPAAPQYAFAPVQSRTPSEYDISWRLSDAMPLATTAPVTARDHFVVAFTQEELIERIEALRDLSLPDEAIRQRYFTRTRSSRYPPGDSRSWNLSTACRALAADEAWRDKIVLCQYRPLDYRHVLWHDALIDWPRREVLRHLLQHDNVALIARRQSPAGLPANYFWATRTLAIDGIIRSDNRGSESLFPLWRYDEEGTPRGNFAPEFIETVSLVLKLPYVDRYEPLDNAAVCEFTPLALAGYIYGSFWSPDYRERFQAELAGDFPRIVPPRDASAFFETSRIGLRLLSWHTQLPDVESGDLPAEESGTIAPGYPRWRDGEVWVSPEQAIAKLSGAAWELRIGSHQVAGKWLKDRRGRQLEPREVATYRSLANVLEATLSLPPGRR